MKRYPQIISKLFYEPLVITPQKHGAICRVMEAHLAGNVAALDVAVPAEHESEMVQVKKTVIIPVHGVISNHMPDTPSGGFGCDLQSVNSMIEVATYDDSVDRIVFDFRSPGGSVTGVPETARKILNIVDKETIAFTDDECCSGALWLAAQCQKFYSTESASIGSVGVWCAYLDISRSMQNEGENMQAISAGKYKLLGAYWKPLTEDERAIVQSGVNKIYAQFKSAMNQQRTMDDKSMGNGLVFDGEEAANMGFTDGTVDSLDELLDMETE